jgi:hypothetical protein
VFFSFFPFFFFHYKLSSLTLYFHNSSEFVKVEVNGVGYGHSWYGRWGYKFCRGSFGVVKHDYDGDIEGLMLLELERSFEILVTRKNAGKSSKYFVTREI